jgi:hypothetical protein
VTVILDVHGPPNCTVLMFFWCLCTWLIIAIYGPSYVTVMTIWACICESYNGYIGLSLLVIMDILELSYLTIIIALDSIWFLMWNCYNGYMRDCLMAMKVPPYATVVMAVHGPLYVPGVIAVNGLAVTQSTCTDIFFRRSFLCIIHSWPTTSHSKLHKFNSY